MADNDTTLGDGELSDDEVSLTGFSPGLPFGWRPGKESSLVRETMAKTIGHWIIWSFAGTLFFICLAHGASVLVMAQQPPLELDGEHAEIWFRWREQLATSVKDFGQIVGTLIAGPLGVVLGFYFRDRQ